MNTEEKQKLLLERQWDLLEGIKSYRLRIPTVIGSVILSITGFVLNSDKIPSDTNQRLIIASIIILLGIMGFIVFRCIHLQYKNIADRICYLYTQLGMNTKEYYNNFKDPVSRAPGIFRALYASIVIISLICALAILIGP